MVHKYCDAIRESSLTFDGSALDLKRIGDFLKDVGDLEGAGDCYRWVAEKTEEGEGSSSQEAFTGTLVTADSS